MTETAAFGEYGDVDVVGEMGVVDDRFVRGNVRGQSDSAALMSGAEQSDQGECTLAVDGKDRMFF